MASKDDTINTNLDLGLGLGLIISSNHHQEIKKQVSLKRDRSFPSLTLSLSPDDDQSSPEPKIDASCVSAVSSFSNSSVAAAVVKKETEEEPVERTVSMCSRAVSDDQEDEQGVPRKKLRLTKQQSATLELTFKQHSTLNPKQKQVLASKLNLRPRQVEVWFQNRRARTKLKQTEEDCEVLKKCCETLTEENKRLQKELKALKLRARVYMKVQPPQTLTICPSCHERIIASDHHHFLNPLTHPSAAC